MKYISHEWLKPFTSLPLHSKYQRRQTRETRLEGSAELSPGQKGLGCALGLRVYRFHQAPDFPAMLASYSVVQSAIITWEHWMDIEKKMLIPDPAGFGPWISARWLPCTLCSPAGGGWIKQKSLGELWRTRPDISTRGLALLPTQEEPKNRPQLPNKMTLSSQPCPSFSRGDTLHRVCMSENRKLCTYFDRRPCHLGGDLPGESRLWKTRPENEERGPSRRWGRSWLEVQSTTGKRWPRSG